MKRSSLHLRRRVNECSEVVPVPERGTLTLHTCMLPPGLPAEEHVHVQAQPESVFASADPS